MLKITISEITESASVDASSQKERLVYTQEFKELNVSQLVTSINKPVRVRKPRESKPKA